VSEYPEMGVSDKAALIRDVRYCSRLVLLRKPSFRLQFEIRDPLVEVRLVVFSLRKLAEISVES
jgi:hypothetical protein